MNNLQGKGTGECLIEAVKIDKVYDQMKEPLQVLLKADLQVFEGEILAVVGASGVGKSTLLHILGGLDRPSSGEVFFRGNNIFQQSNGFLENFRNRHIGFVFQFFNLLSEFSALENAMFPALIQRASKKTAREKAEQLLIQVGLKERLHHKPGELSGGECQRVALARALVNSPDLLLADEPTGNLDDHASDNLINLIRHMNQQFNQTIVIVTHSQRIAGNMDRVLRLNEGKLNPVDARGQAII